MANFDLGALSGQSVTDAIWTVPSQINRNHTNPLDESTLFYSYEEACQYVSSDAGITRSKGSKTVTIKNAYPGQFIAVAQDTGVSGYVVNVDKTLIPIATGGDADELARKLRELSSSLLSSDGIIDQLSGAIDVNAASVSTLSNDTIPVLSSALSSGLSVTVEKLEQPVEDAFATYVVKQGGLSVGDYINVPKDKVIESAYMVNVSAEPSDATKETVSAFVVAYDTTTVKVLSDDSTEGGGAVAAGTFSSIKNAFFGKEGGTGPYLRITVSNQGTPIYIAMPKLVDTYFGATTDTVKVEVNAATHEISASVRPGSIGTASLSADAVTNAKLADDAVQTENVKDAAVTEAKIADDAVTNAKIADGAVATAQLSASAVVTAKIADSAVTSDKIASDAVITAKIADGNVTTAKIADSNVTAAKLAADAVETAKIKDGAVTTEKIADGNVTTAKIADSNVTTGKLAADAVTEAKISADAVTNSKIKDGAVTEGKIGAGAVTNAKIASGAVALANLSADVTGYIDQAEADAVSTAEAYTDTEIQKLDYTATGMAASKTVATLTEEDGKISATFQDIQISEEQVTGLTADLDYLSGQIDGVKDDYLLKSTFSAISSETGLDKASASDKVAIVSEVTAETTRAEAAESALDERLSDAESAIVDLKTMDGTLSGKIDDEIEARGEAITNLSTAVAATYLSASVYNKFKNDSGLSAVDGHEGETDYQVVFVKDIKDLEGAMHFRGVTSTDLSTGDTLIPGGTGYYDEATGKVPTAGDLVINETTAREFAWAGDKWQAVAERPAGWKGRWVELGDEKLYLTRAEFESFKTTTFNPWKSAVEVSSAGFASRLDAAEYAIGELSDTVVPAEKTRAEAAEGALDDRIDELSTYTHALSVSQLVWDIDVISCGTAV